MKKPNPELTDGENPELTAEDFARARPASEIYPDLAAASARRKLSRQKASAKTAASRRANAIAKKGN